MSGEYGIRWLVFVRVEDRSGALTALAGVFSERGVSFESLNTLEVNGGSGLMSISFVSSENLARVLVRTLARLAVVRRLRLERADDPGVRAVAVVDETPDIAIDAPVVQVWSQATLVAGSLREVEEAVERARAAGAPRVSLMVLPPAAASPVP